MFAAEGVLPLDGDARKRNEEMDEENERNTLVGLGTKSKRRGFLAHGGGGGVAVFMGPGYVEGAVESAEEDEGEPWMPRETQSGRVAASRT